MKWGHDHKRVSAIAVSPRVCREAGGADTSSEPPLNFIFITNIILHYFHIFYNIFIIKKIVKNIVKYSEITAKYSNFSELGAIFHDFLIFLFLSLFNILTFSFYHFYLFFFFSFQPHRSKSKIFLPPLHIECSSSVHFRTSPILNSNNHLKRD